MSPLALPLPEIKSEDRPRVGGKGFALAVMERGGLQIPTALCITPEAYLEFVTATGIRETILLELGRKSFEDMRWEEIRDTSLRIRIAFLQAPVPEALRGKLIPFLEAVFSGKSVAVRSSDPGDTRRWYQSLHRSFENLKGLRLKIEDELIPRMVEEAREMAQIALALLSDRELAEEIERRLEIGKKWDNLYKEFCIPFAHGMRLFGQVYNDRLKPENPFEFMDLLSGADMISVQRNRMMESLVRRVRRNSRLAQSMRRGRREGMDPGFLRALESFLAKFGDQSWSKARFDQDPKALFTLLLNMALREPLRRGSAKSDQKSGE